MSVFAELAAQFMSQVNATLEAFRTEIQAKFITNVDPLHKDLHDLLDMQTQAGTKIEKLEAANFVTPEDLQKQIEGLPDLIAEKLGPKVQPPTVQPAITVIDQSLDDRVKRLERVLKNF
jgi:hypothetical protein